LKITLSFTPKYLTAPTCMRKHEPKYFSVQDTLRVSVGHVLETCPVNKTRSVHVSSRIVSDT